MIGVDDVLNRLNTYCEAIIGSTDRDNSICIYGVAVCTRKAMELMGAYILYKETGMENDLDMGNKVFAKLSGADKALNTVHNFSATFKPLYLSLAHALHYQNYLNSAKGEEKEYEQIINDAQQIGFSVWDFSELVGSFFTLLGLEMRECDTATDAVCELRRQNMANNIDKEVFTKRYFEEPLLSLLRNSDIRGWADFYTYASARLTRSIFTEGRRSLQRRIPLEVLFGSAAIDRKMAEKLASTLCPSLQKRNLTLGDYVGEMKTVPKEYKKNHKNALWTNLKEDLSRIQGVANSFLHWSEGTIDTPTPNAEMANTYRDSLMRELDHLYNLMKNNVFTEALNERSPYVQNWFAENAYSEEAHQKEKDELEKALKKEREEREKAEGRLETIRRWVIVLGTIPLLLFVSFLIGRARVRFYHRPTFVNSNAELSEMQLRETPEITVGITGAGISSSPGKYLNYEGAKFAPLSDSETALFYVDEDTYYGNIRFYLQGECKERYALNSSRDKSTMHVVFKRPTNDAGMGEAICWLYKTDAEENIISESGGYECPADAFVLENTDIDSVGWYTLSVQALGASDGYRTEDGLVRSTTGWLHYHFLLLPSGSDADLAYTIENQSDPYAGARDTSTLTAANGDRVHLQIFPTFTDGVGVLCFWDDEKHSEFIPRSDVLFTVPDQLSEGYHELHVQLYYENGQTVLYPTEEQGYSAVIPCVITKRETTEPISITLKDSCGNTVEEGGNYIYTPGDKMDCTITAPRGITRVVLSEKILETGLETVMFDKTSLEEVRITTVTEGEKQFTIEVYGKNYSGSPESIDYASLSFIPLARTHKDETDEKGNTTRKWLYDDSHSHLPTSYIQYTYAYNEDGEFLSWDKSCFSPDDRPILGADGYHRRHVDYAADGSQTLRHFGVNGEPMLVNGHAGWISEPKGENTTLYCYLGLDGEIMPTSRDSSIYYFLQKEDGHGRVIEEYGFNAQMLPMISPYGWHARYLTYDDAGNGIYKRHEDTEGNLCDTTDGFAEAYYTYDAYGNRTERKTYRADGSLIQRYQQKFIDKTDTLVYLVYLDDEGNKVVSEEHGYASVEYPCDPVTGATLEYIYKDEKGHLTPGPDGYARLVCTYKNSYLVQMECQDTDRQPTLCSENWAVMRCERDAYGNALEMSYFDAQGLPVNPVGINNGAAKSLFTWAKIDGTWKKTRESYYGADGSPNPMSADSSCYGMQYLYNGNDTITLFLGEDGKRTSITYGETDFDRRVVTNNTEGNPVREVRYIDEDLAWELFQIDYEYDADGRETGHTEWYDGQGRPYCIVYKRADDPYTKKTYTAEKAMYDKEGNRLLNDEGIWKTVDTRRYDAETGVYTVETSFFDSHALPMQHPSEDYARKVVTYYIDTMAGGTVSLDKCNYDVDFYGLDGMKIKR